MFRPKSKIHLFLRAVFLLPSGIVNLYLEGKYDGNQKIRKTSKCPI